MGGVNIPSESLDKMKAHIKPPYKEDKVSFYEFQKRYNPIDPSLQKLLNQKPWIKDYIDSEELINVSVMLNPKYLPFIDFRVLETKFSGSVSAKQINGQMTYLLNNRAVSQNKIKSFLEKDRENTRMVQQSRTELLKKAASLLTLDKKNILGLARFGKNKALINASKKGYQTLSLELTKQEINTFVKENKNLILYISKKKNIKPLIHTQAQKSHVNPIAFNGYNAQGQNIDILYTEPNCPSPSWFNNTRYTVIDGTQPGSGGTDSDHARIDGDIIRYGASQANLNCGLNVNSQNSGFNNVPEHIDVESYSWGYLTQNVTNVYDGLSAALDNHIYASRNTVCVAAGNRYDEHSNSRYVANPAKALNAISVGAYSRESNTITDFSAWDNADAMNEKPEVVAVGEVWDEHLGGGMVGTSQAAPHVAAIAANYMSRLGGNWNKRAIGIKALIMATATENIAERENIDEDPKDSSVGAGGVQYSLGSWQIWEMFDGGSNSFTRTFYVSQSAINQGKSLRTVLTWLNKGDYTLAHKGHAKIGVDLDMTLKNPNGSLVDISNSWDNPYEIINYKPTIAGTYTMTVSTYAYRDQSSYKKMGLAAVLY